MTGECGILRLHRSWSYLQHRDRIELWSVRSLRRLRLRGDQRLGELLHALEEGVPAAAPEVRLAEATGMDRAVVGQVLAMLRSRGVLIDAPPAARRLPAGASRELFDPQLEFFGTFEQQGAEAAAFQRRLAAATVLIAGLGGLGSWIALLLSRVGVGTLVAVDRDTVELSNLSRQVLFERADALAATAKVEAARARLQAANPELRYVAIRRDVAGPSDLLALVADADLAVLPLTYVGRHRFRDAAAAACVAASTPFLTCGVYAVGPLCVPGASPCHACAVGEDPRFEGLSGDGTGTLQAGRRLLREARFAPWIAIAAGRAVDEAVRFLTGYTAPSVLGGMAIFDPMAATASLLPASRRPECPVCGEARGPASVPPPRINGS